MEHDSESSRRYKQNWDDAVQASKADAAEIAELKEAYALLFKEHARLRASHSGGQAMTVLHECLDSDSPWLICKHCGAVGRCEKDASPPPALTDAPIGYLTRFKSQVKDAEKCFPGELHDHLWSYTHGTKKMEHFAAFPDIEVVPVYAAPQPSKCPTGKCADPARDCYGSGCLSDEPQSAVAAAYGGLVQTPQG